MVTPAGVLFGNKTTGEVWKDHKSVVLPIPVWFEPKNSKTAAAVIAGACYRTIITLKISSYSSFLMPVTSNTKIVRMTLIELSAVAQGCSQEGLIEYD